MSSEYRNNYPAPDDDEHDLDEPVITKRDFQALHGLATLAGHDAADANTLRELALSIHEGIVQHLRLINFNPEQEPVKAQVANDVFHRTSDIYHHYHQHGATFRQHERDEWSQILQGAAAFMPGYDAADVRQAAEQLSHQHDPVQVLRELWSPNDTLIVGSTDDTIDTITDDLPFLQDYPATTDDVTASDVANRHIVGYIPEDLEHLAVTVTQYSVRTVLKDPSEWTWEDYQRLAPEQRELITYRADRVSYGLNHIDDAEMSFVTSEPQQVLHWRRTGLLDRADSIIVVTTDETLSQRWANDGVFDNRTTLMLIEKNVDPDRWINDIPRGSTVIYTDIPDHAEHLIVADRHVLGTLPPHLKHLAATTTSWPHDHNTGAFGQPVTVQNTLIARTPLAD